MKAIIFSFMLTLTAFTHVMASEKEDSLSRLADRLYMVSMFDNNGWGGVPDEWKIRQQIDSMASDSRLIEMATTHPKATARAVAFDLLLNRRNPEVAAILENSLSDHSEIALRSFDFIFQSTIGNFNLMAAEQMCMQDSIQSFVDFQKIDSIILHTPGMTHIDRLKTLIDSLPQSEASYNRLRHLVYDEYYIPAFKALAAYQNAGDIKIINKALLEYANGLDKEHVKRGKTGRTNQALMAVTIWPAPDFRKSIEKVARFEIRRKHIDYMRLKYLYEALLAYGDQWAHDLIEKLLKDHSTIANHYHQIYFLMAYDKNPATGFDDLLPLCESSRESYENFYKESTF